MGVTRRRATLQAGGITAVIGGLGAILVNALHPHPPARTDELLRLVASVPYWTILHYAAALTAGMVVSGLTLLVMTLRHSPARAIGEVGSCVTVLGGAVFVVAIVIDGYGFPYFARLWLAAGANGGASVLWAADTVHTVDRALFPVWCGLFTGLGVLLVAVAVWRSAEYSRSGATLGILGGLMCLLYAVSRVGEFTVPFPIWPWGPALDAIWITLVGGSMLRKATRLTDMSATATRTAGQEQPASRGISTARP